MLALMELFWTKKYEIALLEIKCPDNKRNLSIESIITYIIFYITLQKHLKKENTLVATPKAKFKWDYLG